MRKGQGGRETERKRQGRRERKGGEKQKEKDRGRKICIEVKQIYSST